MKNGEPAAQAEFDRDSMFCTEKSVNVFPPSTTTVVTENRKYVNKGRVCAYNNQTFKTECNETVEVVPERIQQRDANERARNEYKWSCMSSLGWAQHEVLKKQPTSPQAESDRFKGVGGVCKYPADCFGSLTCRNGYCAEPLPYTQPAAKSEVGGQCQQSINCAGDAACYRRICQTRGNECRDNSMCEAGLLCYGGRCLPP